MVFYYYLAITASLALTQVQIHSSNTFYLELTNAYHLLPTNASSQHWRHRSEHTAPTSPNPPSTYILGNCVCGCVCCVVISAMEKSKAGRGMGSGQRWERG